MQEAGQTTPLDIPIVAANDDVEEKLSGKMDHDSGDLDLGDKNVGLRFAVEVPPGATIVTAYVQFSAEEEGQEPATFTIEGEATIGRSTR